MADVLYDNVYVGPWMDRSEGPIRGAKITLTSTGAAILIAFLAIFVQYVGQHLWEIACLVWHQYWRSLPPKMPLQHQQDVALRNNGTPAQTLLYLTQIAWAWRHTRKQLRGVRWWRTVALPPVVPLLFFVLLLAAGILSSSIIDSSDIAILLTGEKCGLWKVPTQEMFADIRNGFRVENGKYLRRTGEFGQIYSRNCYNRTNTQQSPSCRSFARRSIPFTTTVDSPCPFNSSTCQLPTANLRLDTGQMDSNTFFGINSKSDNIKFRRAMTCAPIKPDLFTRRLNYTLSGPRGDKSVYIIHWLYGQFLLIDTDATAYANSLQSTELNYYTSDIITKFRMDERLPWPDQSTFIPRPEFKVLDGDTEIIFLSGNRVIFSEPTDDPWFSAHLPYTIPNTTDFGGYLSDDLAVPMGCVEQYQFCNPHRPGQPCTPLAGINPASAEALSTLKLSPTQSKTVSLILHAVYAMDAHIGHAFDPSSLVLLAMNSVVDAWQLPIPKDQWVIELQHANEVVLAMIQRLVVDYASGPGSTAAQQFIVKPNSTEEKALCRMIRARTNGRFSNVSTYGLSITLILGTLIVIINMTLFPVLVRLRNRRKAPSSKTDRWIADSLFQIHKHVLSIPPSAWEGIRETVPVTERNNMAARLDLGKIEIENESKEHGEVELAVHHVDTQSTVVQEEESPVGPTQVASRSSRVSQAPADEDTEETGNRTEGPRGVVRAKD